MMISRHGGMMTATSSSSSSFLFKSMATSAVAGDGSSSTPLVIPIELISVRTASIGINKKIAGGQ